MEKLSKVQLPPKLRYRIRAWIKKMRGTGAQPIHVEQNLTRKFEEALALKSLKKNEVMASFYKNGALKLDFGGGVSEKAKQAAFEWAKKKGLKIAESSLAKSQGANSSVIFNTSNGSSECIGRAKWAIK
jgi:hypothetical protein